MALSEKHKKAMQAGRKKGIERRRKEAAKVVAKFRAWNERDGEAGANFKAGKISQEERNAVARQLPQVPTDNQYALSRGEGT